MKKFRYIDSLRGLAIIGVIFIHAGDIIDDSVYLPGIWRPLMITGQYGVQLFFVVSAFTLFLSLRQREKEGAVSNRDFFIRRFFRIAPLYYFGILFYTFERFIGFNFLLTGHADQPIPTNALVSNIFFIHGLHPRWINGYVPGGWSVAVEMMFYLFVPYLFRKIKNIDDGITLLLASTVLAFLLHILLRGNNYLDYDYFLYCFFPNQLPVFAIGILTYFIITEDGFYAKPRSYLQLLLTAAFLFYFPFSKHIIFSILGATVLIILSKREYKFFVNRFTVFLGKISYSIYIVHFAVIGQLTKYQLLNLVAGDGSNILLINFLLRFVVVTLISAAIAFVCYHSIELPFQRFAARFNKSFKNKSINALYKSHSL